LGRIAGEHFFRVHTENWTDIRFSSILFFTPLRFSISLDSTNFSQVLQSICDKDKTFEKSRPWQKMCRAERKAGLRQQKKTREISGTLFPLKAAKKKNAL
jgi:hypothetical protein